MNTEHILRDYVALFNATDEENVIQTVPNAAAEDWLLARIPRIAIPDTEIERTYYFRWWTYRKHVKKTPEGYVISEFHPNVGWSGKYNTISCASVQHLREGRWLRENRFLDDYIHFWYSDGGVHLHDYSNAFESAIELLAETRGDDTGMDLIDKMLGSYRLWQRDQQGSLGLYWSNDGRDGSEFSVSGSGLRVTLNCYQYANARAIAKMAERKGRQELADEMNREADTLYQLINKYLWDEKLRFYVTMPQKEPKSEPYEAENQHVRELFGYLPWVFDVAMPGRTEGFRQLLDPQGFAGKVGPTTAERRHEGYGVFYTGEELNRWLEKRGENPLGPDGHECLWNGPSWPFVTAWMLTAVADLLAGNEIQNDIDKKDYLTLLHQYAACHKRKLDDGRVIPWIDENFDPDTGEWIARKRLMNWGGKCFPEDKGGYERGKDYNHSTFCDLVLEGLFGLHVGWDELRITPLFPETWEYAILEDVSVHGRSISVYYDREEGYKVQLAGKTVFVSSTPNSYTIRWREN